MNVHFLLITAFQKMSMYFRLGQVINCLDVSSVLVMYLSIYINTWPDARLGDGHQGIIDESATIPFHLVLF